MDVSSIVQDRPIEDISDTTTDEAETHAFPDAESNKWSNAVSLLSILRIADDLAVKVEPLVFPIQHYHVLGEGASFSVRINQRALHLSQEPEVVKISRQSYESSLSKRFDGPALRAFLTELKVLGNPKLRKNPNITKLHRLSWAITATEPQCIAPALVIEYARHGTLVEFEKESRDSIQWAARKQLALDVARGLQALHECDITHGDVKAENILIFDGDVDGSFLAKISDFGCSVFRKEVDAGHQPPGTVRLPAITSPWHAPEALDLLPPSEVHFTDVFSFGLLCWRIMLMQNPAELFDLPLDKTIKRDLFRQIAELPNLRFMIPDVIGRQIRLQDINEASRLEALFQISLDPVPTRRDLSEVIVLLEAGEAFSEWANAARQRSLVKRLQAVRIEDVNSIKPEPMPPDAAKHNLFSKAGLGFHPSPRLDWPIESSINLSPPLEPLVLEAMSVAHQTLTRHSTALSPREVETYRGVAWSLCSHLLVGIACTKNVDDGIRVLKDAIITTYRNGRWKGTCAYLRLIVAYSVVLPAGEKDLLLRITYDMLQDFKFPLARLSSFFRYEDHECFITRETLEDYALTLQITLAKLRGELPGGPNRRNRLIATRMDNNSTAQQLHKFALLGDVKDLEECLKAGNIDVNLTDENGSTALLLACREGRLETAYALLDAGADAGIENDMHENGLHWLSSFPSDEQDRLATTLRSAGARLYPSDSASALKFPDFDEDNYIMNGFVPGSPIMRAIAKSDRSSFVTLWNMLLDDAQNGRFHSSLLLAQFYQPIRLAFMLNVYAIAPLLVKTLIQVLPQVYRDTDQDIHVLIMYWMDDMVPTSLFIDAISAQHRLARITLHGPWHSIAQRQCLHLLLEYKLWSLSPDHPEAAASLIRWCLTYRNDEALSLVLKNGDIQKHINVVSMGQTLIDLAMEYSRIEAFQMLVKAGAELNLEGSNASPHLLQRFGQSYLHSCAVNRIVDLEFARTIMEHGVPPTAADRRGITVLFYALQKANFPLARLLIERGADLNSILTFKDSRYTLLGLLLDRNFIWQFDSQLDSIRFLLSLQGKDKQVSFLVAPDEDYSALIKAASYTDTDEGTSSVFRLLLEHFNTSEEINFRSARMGITAIHAAIMAANSVAVQLLVEAGADVETQAFGLTLLELAMDQFNQKYDRYKTLPKKEQEENIRQYLEIITTLSQASSLGEMEARSKVFTELWEASREVMGYFMQAPHFFINKHNSILYEIVNGHMNMLQLPLDVKSDKDLSLLEDTRRQLDRIIAPIFHVELRCSITLADPTVPHGTVATTGRDNKLTRDKVIQRLPMLENINVRRWIELKQASLLEYLLDVERQRPLDEAAPNGMFGFGKVAWTGKPEHFKYDYRYVAYPSSLLDCWKSLFQEGMVMPAEEGDDLIIMRFIRILRIRNKQLEARMFPLEPFDLEFRTFHFRDVLGVEDGEVELDDLRTAIGLNWHCRCMREAIGELQLGGAVGQDERMKGEPARPEPWDLGREYRERKAKHEVSVNSRKIENAFKRLLFESEDLLVRHPDTFRELFGEYLEGTQSWEELDARTATILSEAQ